MLKLSLLKLLVLLTLLSCTAAYAKEHCDKDFDICSEDETDDEDTHNVWEEADFKEEDRNDESAPLLSDDFNELELEIFVHFFSNLKDWSPTSESLSKYHPEDLVAAIMRTFHAIDGNDDGFLDYEEATELMKKGKSDLEKVKRIIEEFPEGRMSILQYLNVFKKLGEGKDTIPLLSPFDKLEYMPPVAAKRIMLGSVEMFKDSDEDKNGKLDKDEFAQGMKRSKEKRGEELSHVDVTDGQSNALFDMIDKDNDNHLTYPEFQATMPPAPERKSFEQTIGDIFRDADLDSDMEISQEEFKFHMTDRAEKMGAAAPPSEEQIALAFEKLDRDKSGALSQAEMQSLFEEVKQVQEKRLVEAFSNFDKDGDEVLSLDEVQSIADEMEKATGQKIDAKTLMKMIDSDKDGVVSLEEMQVTLSKMAAQPIQ